MPVLVTCKFDKDPIKVTDKTRDTVLPIICQWELFVAMVTTVLIRFASKPNAAFLHPKDATDKIDCCRTKRALRGLKCSYF